MIFNTADKIDYIYIKLCYLLHKPSSFHDFNYHFAQNMALISSPLLFFLSTVFVLISQANGQSSVSHFCLYDQGNYSTILNVSRQTPGVYVLKVLLGQKIYSQKVIITR